MAKVIFGSGIVALLAREVVTGPWDIVPFGRSRFYSFNPPPADNHIIRDKDTDAAMADICAQFGLQTQPVAFYRRAYSVLGQLTKSYDADLCNSWLHKIFSDRIPSQSIPYWKMRMVSTVYPVRVNTLYGKLLAKYWQQLKTEAAKGDVTEIGDHYYIKAGARVEFDEAICTIPLQALATLARASIDVKCLPLHALHIKSDKIDLEGMNQVFVVDTLLDFFQVTNISPGHYVFYSTDYIANPGQYLSPIVGTHEIIDGTAVDGAIPTGEIPDLSYLEKLGIYCIGSHAVHDWCADVGSCLLRTLRYVGRGHKPV